MKKNTKLILVVILLTSVILFLSKVYIFEENIEEKSVKNQNNSDAPSGVSQEFKESWFGDKMEK